jgi:hypothetical protein
MEWCSLPVPDWRFNKSLTAGCVLQSGIWPCVYIKTTTN